MEFDQINLTTRDHVDRRTVYALLGSVAALLAIFTVFNALNGFQALRERSAYLSQIRDLRQQARTLSGEFQNGGGFDEDAAAAMRNRNHYANYLIALDVFPWIKIMDELEKTIPAQIILDGFHPAQDLKTIRITGFTPSVEPITQFQNALEQSALFASVIIGNMDLGDGPPANKRSAGNGAIHFEMRCGMNLKAVLPEETYGELWMTLTSETIDTIRKRGT